ncbi:MAG: hypothetical protein ACI9XR_001294 [Flavobacterium sp.]|jgi:hypothetical protein
MKKILFVTLFCSTFFANAQEVKKQLGDFTKVTAFDKIDVLLVKSTENKIEITGSDAESVQVVNKNGELKIRLPFTKLLSGDTISATVFFTNLDAVEANEGSRLACESVLKATAFDIIAKEGATIKIQLNVTSASVKATSGANVTISGNATTQNINISSGGILNASEFKTKTTNVTISAGGEAEVNASDFVDAKVRAGGNVSVYGNPKQVNEKTFAGGKIERVN